MTRDRWDDLYQLFGDRGAYSGCWCQWFRAPNAVYQRRGNEGNRAAMREAVDDDHVPGLLAYREGQPVGWVSVSPRRDYGRIVGDEDTADREEALEPKASPVWAVVCFYIDRHHRGTGVASALLAAAVEHARDSGASVLEAYPIEPEGQTDNASAFTGLRSMFERAGFRETGRFDRWRAAPVASGPDARALARPPGRPVLRLKLRAASRSRC